jgi:hypothetical protein
MDLTARLPSMEDTALAVLRENAARLELSGTAAQKSAAAALLPAIEAELATRREAKRAELAARRAAKSGSTGRSKRATAKRAATDED